MDEERARRPDRARACSPARCQNDQVLVGTALHAATVSHRFAAKQRLFFHGSGSFNLRETTNFGVVGTVVKGFTAWCGQNAAKLS